MNTPHVPNLSTARYRVLAIAKLRRRSFMDIDDRIATAKSLIARREEIDAQLAALFRGQTPQKRQQKCSRCGEVGHRADTCPQKQERLPEQPLSLVESGER
jgi:hypothetical protein